MAMSAEIAQNLQTPYKWKILSRDENLDEAV